MERVQLGDFKRITFGHCITSLSKTFTLGLVESDQPFPLKACHSPIYPGDRDWREYYRSKNLNLPNQYHNCVIWPMLGGFHVASLVQGRQVRAAKTMLTLLAEESRNGRTQEWEFNEWLYGLSGRSIGYPLQA